MKMSRKQKDIRVKRLLTEKEAFYLIGYNPYSDDDENMFMSKEQWKKLDLLLDLGIYKG